MDELQQVLLEVSNQLNEAIEGARRAGYLARRLGLPHLDEQLEAYLLPTLERFADASPDAPQAGAIGQLLALVASDNGGEPLL